MALRHDDHPTERVDRVERVERVHDDRPQATNVNVGGGRTAPTPVWTVTSVVTLIFTVLEVLLFLRFIFKLAGANANQPLVNALYGVTEPLTRPFQGIFAQPSGALVIVDVPALLAIVFLFLIAALIVALVRAITSPRVY